MHSVSQKSIEQDSKMMMESLEKGLMNSGSIDRDLVNFDIDRKL